MNGKFSFPKEKMLQIVYLKYQIIGIVKNSFVYVIMYHHGKFNTLNCTLYICSLK